MDFRPNRTLGGLPFLLLISSMARPVVRAPIAIVVAAAMLVAMLPSSTSAAPTGKTWTAEIAGAAAAIYYLGKLHVDNEKADKTGNDADGVVDQNQLSVTNPLPGLPVSTPPPVGVSMRQVRTRLLNDIANPKLLQDSPTDDDTHKRFAALRGDYERLRGCWNAFIYAAPSPSPKSSSSAAPGQPAGGPTPAPSKPAGGNRTHPTPKPKAPGGRTARGDQALGQDLVVAQDTPAPPQTPSASPSPTTCTSDFSKIENLYFAQAQRIDMVDLKTAVDTAPTLYQEVLDLRVGSHIDDNDLRAHYLYVLGRALDDALKNPKPGFIVTGASGTGSINISTLAKSCVFSLTATDCISALGSAESTAAADRRQDVACDIARRSWLPSYTAIKRVYATWISSMPGKEIPYNLDFGAVPGC